MAPPRSTGVAGIRGGGHRKASRSGEAFVPHAWKSGDIHTRATRAKRGPNTKRIKPGIRLDTLAKGARRRRRGKGNYGFGLRPGIGAKGKERGKAPRAGQGGAAIGSGVVASWRRQNNVVEIRIVDQAFHVSPRRRGRGPMGAPVVASPDEHNKADRAGRLDPRLSRGFLHRGRWPGSDEFARFGRDERVLHRGDILELAPRQFVQHEIELNGKRIYPRALGGVETVGREK